MKAAGLLVLATLLQLTGCATTKEHPLPYTGPTATVSLVPSNGIMQGKFYVYEKQAKGCFTKRELTVPENQKIRGLYEAQLPLSKPLYILYTESTKGISCDVSISFIAEPDTEYQLASPRWCDMFLYKKGPDGQKRRDSYEPHTANKEKRC